METEQTKFALQTDRWTCIKAPISSAYDDDLLKLIKSKHSTTIAEYLYIMQFCPKNNQTGFDMTASNEMFAFIEKIHMESNAAIAIDIKKMGIPNVEVIIAQLELGNKMKGTILRCAMTMPVFQLAAFKIEITANPPHTPTDAFLNHGESMDWAALGISASDLKKLKKSLAQPKPK